MSPYGSSQVRRSTNILPPLVLPLRDTISRPAASAALPVDSIEVTSLCISHVTLETAPADLIQFLHHEFSAELLRGNTYPQEEALDLDAFKAYYFAADVFIGIVVPRDSTPTTLEMAGAGRPWPTCVSGFYYIKPNYPGRSSHICNAGFVVANEFRGRGVGGALARSFLHFAPKLGYKGSVFNLVYASNVASLALWDRLGFTRAGVIPKAGRLRQEDGTEAFVDAFIIYKSFEETET
ncbi:hypothetical protein FRB94_005122 [Tulasnella sp. JGI-2019a]|nr:hypothetical protein FRB94_005122 [Tulasnella sp. JGI-2019a]KAG9030331.1 hypothetical protein FRB95_004116 [Tulasnella sp. JGI-2019a]